MKKKIVSNVLVTMLIVSSLFSFTGCQNSNIKESKKEEVVENKNDDTKVIVQKIKGIDKLTIVKDSKNVDLDKFVNEMVKDSEEIEEVLLDTSKVNIKKCGQYKVEVTAVQKMKEDSADFDQKENLKEGTTDKKMDTNADEPEKNDTELKGSVSVEVVDEKEVDLKLKDHKIVIGDNNKEVKEEVKESDESKEEKEEKKEEDSKEDSSSKKNKKEEGSSSSSSSSGSSSSGGSSASKPEPKPQPELKPEPKPQPEPEPYWVDEVGHWEKVMVEEAIEVPVYEIHAICSDCGADITGQTGTHWCGGLKGWHDEEVQVGTKILPPIYEDRWVVDVPGHWEYK